MTQPSAPPDLETRIANRKRDLISEIIELKTGSRIDAAETIDRLKGRLSDLAHIVKEGLVDGWSNINDRTRRRLDEWVAR